MNDQANRLRRLVRDAALADSAGSGHRPRLVVLGGGRSGVGATTLAIELAAGLAAQGPRVVLVDADLRGGDLARRCRLDGNRGLGDVLAGRAQVVDVLQDGPAGIQVLAGPGPAEKRGDFPPAAGEQLLDQLCQLGTQAEMLLVDAGSEPARTIYRFWQAADIVLAVTSPEAAAIVDTYAAIKRLDDVSGGGMDGAIYIVVNQAPDQEAVRAIHAGISRSCRRFLAFDVGLAGSVRRDPALAEPRAATGWPESAGAGDGADDDLAALSRWLLATLAMRRSPLPALPPVAALRPVA